MRARNVLASSVLFVLATTVLAQGSGAPKAGASRAVIIPDSDTKWTDLGADAPGVKIADLWGNHATGAFGALIKFPAGFTAPMHTHTNDFKVVVVSGTWVHGPEGKPEVRLGPGSYVMQPGGNYRHTTLCDNASECVFFVQSKGKFDLLPVGGEKAPAPAKE